MRETVSNIKTIKLLTEETTAHLLTTTCCYLLMPLLNIGLVAEVHAIGVAKLMSEAIALLMASAKVLITSTPFVILKLQPWEWQAHLRSSLSTSNREGHPQGVTVAVVVQASKQGFKKKKMPKKQ